MFLIHCIVHILEINEGEDPIEDPCSR